MVNGQWSMPATGRAVRRDDFSNRQPAEAVRPHDFSDRQPAEIVRAHESSKAPLISHWPLAIRILLSVALLCGGVSAQAPPTGDVTVTADHLPNRNRTTELRARVFAEQVIDPTPRLLFTVSGFAEGLLARRGLERPSRHTNAGAAIVRVQEASARYTRQRFEVLAGFTPVVWGRLDEVQPTDVVNPLDLSRFFFEGRSQARLPVALIRGRAFLSEGTTLEGIYVPFFRRGRFDQLDEPTSPFNIETSFVPDPPACLAIGCPGVLPVTIERREPPAAFRSAQGGARLTATTGRLDWSVAAYRGFEPFGLGTFAPIAPQAESVGIHIVHPRFTMIGGDFETVRGPWGLRGEVAAFVDDNFQAGGLCPPQCTPASLRVVRGSSVDGGLGFDRRAGDYRISVGFLAHRESYDESIEPGGSRRSRSEASLVLSADRSFAAERYQLRTFGVYNATESSAFLRGIATARIRDNVALEGSAGWFAGDGGAVIGRFSDSDFGYVRVKYYF
jgi:hypothetical protein